VTIGTACYTFLLRKANRIVKLHLFALLLEFSMPVP